MVVETFDSFHENMGTVILPSLKKLKAYSQYVNAAKMEPVNV